MLPAMVTYSHVALRASDARVSTSSIHETRSSSSPMGISLCASRTARSTSSCVTPGGQSNCAVSTMGDAGLQGGLDAICGAHGRHLSERISQKSAHCTVRICIAESRRAQLRACYLRRFQKRRHAGHHAAERGQRAVSPRHGKSTKTPNGTRRTTRCPPESTCA